MDFQSPIEYREKYSPKSSLKLFSCPNYCLEDNVYIYDVCESEYIHLRCDICSCNWYICHNCEKQQKHFQTLTQLKRHSLRSCQDQVSQLSSNPSPYKLQKIDITSGLNKCLELEEFKSLALFGRSENIMFYYFEQFDRGVHYLIGITIQFE